MIMMIDLARTQIPGFLFFLSIIYRYLVDKTTIRSILMMNFILT